MTGPLPNLLLPITIPLSLLYSRAIELRNARYDRGRGVQRLAHPVISIGNITTGGTGKTPLTAHIATWLTESGHQPVIALRGYGARSGQPADEEAEYRWRFPDIPIVANPDRFMALQQHFTQGGRGDCVLLDDGFQHRQIARDLDLVLIDASRYTFADRLLPAGNLREPLTNLKRADAVIITRAQAVDDHLAAQVEQHHSKPPLAWAQHRWSHLNIPGPGGEQQEQPQWLAGRRVVTMHGVGNPAAVQQQIQQHGATITADVPAADHQHYTRSMVDSARSLCDEADALIVTGKDWVKLQQLVDPADWPCPLVIPIVEVAFLAGERELHDLVLAAIQ